MTSGTDAPRPTAGSDPNDLDDVCCFEEDGVPCRASLDDNEGYCGPHADRLEAAGHWS